VEESHAKSLLAELHGLMLDEAGRGLAMRTEHRGRAHIDLGRRLDLDRAIGASALREVGEAIDVAVEARLRTRA
jgi:hypothetical protein